MIKPAGEAPHNCGLCPRLVAFRAENAALFPSYFNQPVPSFGTENPRLLIVGLAPGLHGANQTGRPFTNDYAGDLLYPTLLQYGFATGEYGKNAHDGLQLVDCQITNAVRCVPPQNKPDGAEIKTCNSFLAQKLRALTTVQVVVALGGIAHNAVLQASGQKISAAKFAHGAVHNLPNGSQLISSYHCSRYNTNTGRLTAPMFHAIFAAARSAIG